MLTSPMISLLGRDYPSQPTRKIDPAGEVLRLRQMIHAARFLMEHCVTSERQEFVKARTLLATFENSLGRMAATPPDPASTELWEQTPSSF